MKDNRLTNRFAHDAALEKHPAAPAVKGIFFDVDDTLYDHLPPFTKAVQDVLQLGEAFPYEAAYRRMRHYSDVLSEQMGGAGALEAGAVTELMRTRRFQLALGEFDVALTNEQAAAIQAAYIGCQYDIIMFPGAKAMLERLVKAGYIVGLITNGAGAHQRRKIEAMDIDDLIPRGRQFISGEVGWDKPDPRIFKLVNERTGTLPENSIYIGDSWNNDVVGALQAGWTSIWFNHRQVQPLTEHAPAYIMSGYADLQEQLVKMGVLPE
ncbi:HAD family hydrolase [Paenibacillus sp. BIHB 4019]|uniref:HAD family hydrolase n=1 Tax=Paenibacillus sp. BIHB 4019 TaxID=1870819 RepID=UPI001F34F32D|nr:HAD family hydrolase [Paenibacillus sp. BIHB 4019]